MFIQSLFNRFTPTGSTRFHRDLGAIAIGLLIAAFSLNTSASELASTAGSDSTANGERVSTSQGLPNNPLSITGRAGPTGSVTVKARDAAGDTATTKSGLFSDFEIYDADVTLYFDDDFDGHYYGIDVNFDADTDYASADVYARLYLSLEGGPWELYYTTEIFTIFGDSGSDDFTVETELYSGYPTAYYDVLIELYDAEYGDFVAEFGPQDSDQLLDAPLEDQLKDAGVVTVGPDPIISQSRGGGGSFSWLILGLLTATLVARTRALKRSRQAALPVTSRSTG